MSGIQSIIQQQLTPETINQISQTIGADPATTQQAVSAAVPMIMAGAAAHAATPEGAQALTSTADANATGLGNLGGILSNAGGLGGVLGGLSGMMGGGGGAGGILGSILGGNHSAVQDGVTQSTGLDRQQAGKLLMILGPIVLAAIAHHRSQTNASPADVSADLQREAQAHANHPQFGGILGSILNKATGQT